MTNIKRLVILGNALPRRCGIATFSTDLASAMIAAVPQLETSIVAMTDHGQHYDYPPLVRMEIQDDQLADYIGAADALNASGVDVVSLQHEFGIFGGEAGSHILVLVKRLTMPVVTTFHTVLAQPDSAQRRVVERLVALSAKVIVMAEKGRSLLKSVYQVPDGKIEVIAHGIPDMPFCDPEEAKARLGYTGRQVILTFGLLSPNKGIEVMIDAMPQIVARCPDAVYVVLGATHPNLVRDQGESHREQLLQQAARLGVSDHVVFLNHFVDQETLLDFVSMCDVYVTPYLNEAQMTSGTLACSFGLGKAVVSTPYWHASELLADGRGVLVPFGDAGAIGGAVADLLSDDDRRQEMRERAWLDSRPMIWDRIALRYCDVLDSVARKTVPLRALKPLHPVATAKLPALPEISLSYFNSMCDDTGLFQHAVHSVPDRSHGYCVDDNARAMILACALEREAHPLPEVMHSRFAAFLQHAFHPDTKRFRNFMSYDRRWLEDQGSEDSHGRTLWALGICSRDAPNPSRRIWAAHLFRQAVEVVETFSSPRAWAFTLLGLAAYSEGAGNEIYIRELQRFLASRLMALLLAVESPEWIWFEENLTYDNARLPQALIETGQSLGVASYTDAGLRTLTWLVARQTSDTLKFRPVGTRGFFEHRTISDAFDQQPLEATATISACLAAFAANHDPAWKAEAARAFTWFHGHNDLSIPLVDSDTGSCRDGLHPDRANENCGGESVVSYLLSLAEVRQLASQVQVTRGPVRMTAPVALDGQGFGASSA